MVGLRGAPTSFFPPLFLRAISMKRSAASRTSGTTSSPGLCRMEPYTANSHHLTIPLCGAFGGSDNSDVVSQVGVIYQLSWVLIRKPSLVDLTAQVYFSFFTIYNFCLGRTTGRKNKAAHQPGVTFREDALAPRNGCLIYKLMLSRHV